MSLGLFLLDLLRSQHMPLVLVLLVSVLTGLLMVFIFRHTSNQNEIRRAKEQLQAHLLAVRLFQDQLGVVLREYRRILSGSGRYIKATLKPTAILLVPVVLLIVQLDRYFEWSPLQPQQAFLVKVKVADPSSLKLVKLDLPPGLTITAPPVHIPQENEVTWRVSAEREGQYDATVMVDGQSLAKHIVIANGLARISPARWRGHFWERVAESAESALPASAPIEAIHVTYPDRDINIGFAEWNWIIVFFIASMIAAFIFKKALGIHI
jgi:hypothetical protein